VLTLLTNQLAIHLIGSFARTQYALLIGYGADEPGKHFKLLSPMISRKGIITQIWSRSKYSAPDGKIASLTKQQQNAIAQKHAAIDIKSDVRIHDASQSTALMWAVFPTVTSKRAPLVRSFCNTKNQQVARPLALGHLMVTKYSANPVTWTLEKKARYSTLGVNPNSA